MFDACSYNYTNVYCILVYVFITHAFFTFFVIKEQLENATMSKMCVYYLIKQNFLLQYSDAVGWVFDV